MANKDIIQELSDLGSDLARSVPQNPYLVPKEYFEGFAGQVLSLVKSDEYLSSLPKENPYQVPVGYFEGFEERMMKVIRNHADYQTSKEELESISSLLSSLNKRPVYSVPQGYFENFAVNGEEKPTREKVVSMSSRKWFKYAAAAVVTGVVALTALILLNRSNQHEDGAGKTSLAKFEKEVRKIDDVKSTENLIDFMDAGLNEKELASNGKTGKTEDVQQLLQDVSTAELKEFSDQSKDIEDVMMTN